MIWTRSGIAREITPREHMRQQVLPEREPVGAIGRASQQIAVLICYSPTAPRMMLPPYARLHELAFSKT